VNQALENTGATAPNRRKLHTDEAGALDLKKAGLRPLALSSPRTMHQNDRSSSAPSTCVRGPIATVLTVSSLLLLTGIKECKSTYFVCVAGGGDQGRGESGLERWEPKISIRREQS